MLHSTMWSNYCNCLCHHMRKRFDDHRIHDAYSKRSYNCAYRSRMTGWFDHWLALKIYEREKKNNFKSCSNVWYRSIINEHSLLTFIHRELNDLFDFATKCVLDASAFVVGFIFAGTINSVIACRIVTFTVFIIMAITFYTVNGRAWHSILYTAIAAIFKKRNMKCGC